MTANATNTYTNDAKMSLKLMVHKDKRRVIFAEANNHFVDTLFSIMTLALGTIVRILGKFPDENVKSLGSLQNVYKSLVDLPANHFLAEEGKSLMLNPRTSSYDHCKKLRLSIDDTKPPKYYVCTKWDFQNFSTCSISRCKYCQKLMSCEVKDRDSISNNGGCHVDDGVFVSDVTTFMVTDDLRVMPNTSNYIILLFREHGITNATQIEERTLDIGLEQTLLLLKLALTFRCPLTYLVFSSMNGIQKLDYFKHGTTVNPSISDQKATTFERMTLKVTLQKSSSKFLFAEAGSDFVEFVFSFLDIPLGTVVGKLMNGASGVETMDNLYASISSKSVGECIKSQDLINMLLQPQLVLKYLSQNQLFPLNVFNTSFNVRYDWNTHTRFLTHDIEIKSPYYASLKDPRVQGKYLKSSAKYMFD